MERISSRPLLLVTMPSCSLKSNFMRPSTSSSWKCRLRRRPRSRDLDFRQREIVSADEPDRAAPEQRTDDALRADEPVLRVRALQDLVEQEQQRRRARRELVELRSRVISA